MGAPPSVVQAVQAAILASAHLAAYENVSAAAQACRRLGGLTSGRWRSVARDLDSLEDELQTAFASAAETLTDRAAGVGVDEDTLWTTGDAAATLDLLRDAALEEIEPDDAPAAQILQGNVLFGTAFVEDPDVPDRGTTLLFAWPQPLAPATWPWQASWVVGDSQGDEDEDESASEELDLYDAGELEGADSMLTELADELQCSRDDARTALHEAALALTRASLLAGTDSGDEEDEIEDEQQHNGRS